MSGNAVLVQIGRLKLKIWITLRWIVNRPERLGSVTVFLWRKAGWINLCITSVVFFIQLEVYSTRHLHVLSNAVFSFVNQPLTCRDALKLFRKKKEPGILREVPWKPERCAVPREPRSAVTTSRLIYRVLTTNLFVRDFTEHILLGGNKIFYRGNLLPDIDCDLTWDIGREMLSLELINVSETWKQKLYHKFLTERDNNLWYIKSAAFEWRYVRKLRSRIRLREGLVDEFSRFLGVVTSIIDENGADLIYWHYAICINDVWTKIWCRDSAPESAWDDV